MKKHIVLICDGGKQFGIVVEEMSVDRIVKAIVNDLTNPTKLFIRTADYLTDAEVTQNLYVRTSTINAIVVVTPEKNVVVPNKSIFIPNNGKMN